MKLEEPHRIKDYELYLNKMVSVLFNHKPDLNPRKSMSVMASEGDSVLVDKLSEAVFELALTSDYGPQGTTQDYVVTITPISNLVIFTIYRPLWSRPEFEFTLTRRDIHRCYRALKNNETK